jgi:hypothetical protein
MKVDRREFSMFILAGAFAAPFTPLLSAKKAEQMLRTVIFESSIQDAVVMSKTFEARGFSSMGVEPDPMEAMMRAREILSNHNATIVGITRRATRDVVLRANNHLIQPVRAPDTVITISLHELIVWNISSAGRLLDVKSLGGSREVQFLGDGHEAA